ncbi:olfactory receptor 1C1-like [Ranitomeya imitator]|uniref:olfactory receptor 1C1-like n=1 Tax=Ranitomeya imitator TaxID=111125 RepID=UPI0037E9A840
MGELEGSICRQRYDNLSESNQPALQADIMNQSSTDFFYITPFFSHSGSKLLPFNIFLFIYLIGLLMNILILTVIYVNNHLHVPLYMFLCNLSYIDICSTTSTIPKLLDMILTGNNTISFTQCFTQTFFFLLAASAEDILLFIMAYDRYVAICNPLHYHHLLNKKICTMFIFTIWILASLNSILMTIPVSKMSFCNSNIIQHFFCEANTLTQMSCAGKDIFYIIVYFELIFFGLCPFLCSLTSYIKIINVILKIKSRDGKRKAFSTCSSHLAVIILYYATGASMYMIPPSKYSHAMEQIATILCTAVTPILNPLIYSLRNKDVMKGLRKFGGAKLRIIGNEI